MSDAMCEVYEPTLIDNLKSKFRSAQYKIKMIIVNFSLSIIRWASKDSNYKSHAQEEFRALGYIPLDQDQEDGPNKWIQENVMDLLSLFATQGHSGSSAPYCVDCFRKLALFKPLSPIKCDDSEWMESSFSGDDHYQNKRLSSVFKEGKDGKPYYIDAIVWCNQKGVTYSGSALNNRGIRIQSRQFIKLPFIPKTFYIDVIEKEIAKDDFEFYIKDETQLKEVFEYYEVT